jgi:hypothetical protein
MFIEEQPDEPQPEQPPPIYIDELVAELAQAVADITRAMDYALATKTPPPSVQAALQRLHDFVERLNNI